MAWNDPAPARRSRPAQPSSPSASPGYGAGNSLPFLSILGRGFVALFIGGVAYWAAHTAVVSWRGAHHAAPSVVSDMAIALAVAALFGALSLRYLLNQPRLSGLPGGGGFWSRQRGYDDIVYPTLGQQVAAGIVDAVIDGIIED
jgi:hypothetical protein